MVQKLTIVTQFEWYVTQYNLKGYFIISCNSIIIHSPVEYISLSFNNVINTTRHSLHKLFDSSMMVSTLRRRYIIMDYWNNYEIHNIKGFDNIISAHPFTISMCVCARACKPTTTTRTRGHKRLAVASGQRATFRHNFPVRRTPHGCAAPFNNILPARRIAVRSECILIAANSISYFFRTNSAKL